MSYYVLDKICEINKGKQIDTDLLDDANEYKYINGGINHSGYYSDFNTVGETIIISEGGASCGYVNYIDEKFWCGCHCYKLTNCKFPVKYMYYALKGNQEKIMALRTGAAMPNINKKNISLLEIKLTDNVQEQDEIINILDKITDLIDKHNEQLQKLDELVKARFVEMFGTLHDNKKHFNIVSIEDVCSLIKDGTHQTPTYTEDKESGYKFLSSKDVMSQKIDWSNIKYIPKDLHEKLYATLQPQKNDILMSKNGVNYGVAAVNNTDEIFDIYVSLALLRPLNIINPAFLKCVINTLDTKRQFDASIKGIGVPNLHLSEIKKTKIMLPPIHLQNEFVLFESYVDKQKLQIQKSLKKIETLKMALMQRYFG